MKIILKAWLKLNKLITSSKSYTAMVVSAGSMDIDDIISAIEEEGSELKADTYLNAITRFNSKASQMVLSGYNVNTGLVYMRSTIRGNFTDKTWDSNANSVHITIRPGADLAAAVAETTVEILGIQSDPIEILSITDQYTGKTDGSLTKGRNAEIKGSYLKIAGDNTACGITFTNIATQAVTKLETADIVLNEPSRLLIFVPASLVAGEYELTVTTQFTSGNSLLKEPRSVTDDLTIIIS